MNLPTLAESLAATQTPDHPLGLRGFTAPEVDRHGFTTHDVARRLRVGEDKVRAWIASGQLAAVNTSTTLAGRPRWVVTPEALAEFERRRAGGPALKQQRRKRTVAKDFYPD